jgi:hypothetical protein
MDELGWRVGLLGAGLMLALVWFARALRRAPKRRSRWERLRDETATPVYSPYLLAGESRFDAGAEQAGGDLAGGDTSGDAGGGGGGSD